MSRDSLPPLAFGQDDIPEDLKPYAPMTAATKLLDQVLKEARVVATETSPELYRALERLEAERAAWKAMSDATTVVFNYRGQKSDLVALSQMSEDDFDAFIAQEKSLWDSWHVAHNRLVELGLMKP